MNQQGENAFDYYDDYCLPFPIIQTRKDKIKEFYLKYFDIPVRLIVVGTVYYFLMSLVV